MAGVDGCVRYIGRHGGRLGAACAVGWWLMWVDERVVRVRVPMALSMVVSCALAVGEGHGWECAWSLAL